MTGSINYMKNVFDESKLGKIVGHQNGTMVTITKVGDLRLTNSILLKNVLVVIGYCVNLLSVHKLSRDSKMFIGLDDKNCYI